MNLPITVQFALVFLLLAGILTGKAWTYRLWARWFGDNAPRTAGHATWAADWMDWLAPWFALAAFTLGFVAMLMEVCQ